MKTLRSAKHKRLLTVERLEKLKREGSPDYEMELVRFNIAEEERRKEAKTKESRTKPAKFSRQKRDRRQPNGDKRGNNTRANAAGERQNKNYKPRNNDNRKNVSTSAPNPNKIEGGEKVVTDVVANIEQMPIANSYIDKAVEQLIGNVGEKTE
jgi:signal recognition particle GTPase